MHHPATRYIKYLMTQGIPDAAALNGVLEPLCLAPVTSDQFSQIYGTLYSTSARVPPSVRKYWLEPADSKRREQPPKGYAEAMRALDVPDNLSRDQVIATELAMNPRLCATMQALIAKQVKPVECAALLTARYEHQVSPEEVSAFEHLLFDVARMRRPDWVSYFHATANIQDEILRNLLRVNLVEIFKLSLEELKTKHRLPAKISFSDSLAELHATAMMKFRDLADARNPQSEAQARQWAQLAMSSGAQYEKFRSTDLTDFGKEVQMRFTFTHTEFPTIAELQTKKG